MPALLSDEKIARLRRVTLEPAPLDGETRRLYALPLVDEFAAVPTNGYALAIYATELDPKMSHRDPDGSLVLDSSSVRPVEHVGWAFHLPWAKNPVPANKPSGGSHWRSVWRATAPVRETGFQLARAARIGGQPRIRVRLDWEVTTRHTRDEDNLVPCMKALVDGIRTAGVIPDDDRRYCLRDMPEIHYAPAGRNRYPHMKLWIWKVPGLAPA